MGNNADNEGKDMERRRWQFDRRVTLGEVIGAVGIMSTLYFAGSNLVTEFRTANSTMDKRVSILEERANMQTRIDASQDSVSRDGQQRLETSVAEILRYLRDPARPR